MKTDSLKITPLLIFILLMPLFFGVTGIKAAPGDLDPTFGNGGIVSTVIENNSSASDIAVQADGKILIVGFTYFNGLSKTFLARYNADGSLDATFGSGGKVVTSFGSENIGFSIALQADGRIVVAGFKYGDDDNFFVARFESDGSPDASFNGVGFVTFDMGGDESAHDLVIQPDGKIVVVGGSNLFPGFIILRLNSDGSFDNSFDGDGRVTTSLGTSGSRAFGVALQPDGKIIAAGVKGNSSVNNGGFALVRYHPNGSLDSTFDSDGIAVTPISNAYDAAYDIAVQSDGKIVAAGETYFVVDGGFLFAFGIVRYNPDGKLDASFDGDGIAVTYIANASSSAFSVAIQTNGKIVAVGMLENMDMNYSSVIVRYNPNGSLDPTFQGGIITGTGEWLNSIALQPDGKIIAGGGSFGEVTIARFMGDAVVRNRQLFDFDGDGKTDVGVYRPSNGQWWYIRSSDSQSAAAQFSASTDLPVPGDYTGDGKADIAHFRPATGEWFILRSEDGSYYSYPFGLPGDIPAPADYDGDSITDTATFRPSTQTWYIFNSGSGTYSILTFGLEGDKPVPADFDGDGKADIATWRSSNGTWWIVRSSNLEQRGYGFGLGTDKPVPGDYTGDGKADIAVWRGSTGEWFFLRSEDSSYYSLPFGLAGDIPAPGDYDGDGRFDTAVFRPTETNWYVQRSSAGIMIRQFGLAGDTPIPSSYLP